MLIAGLLAGCALLEDQRLALQDLREEVRGMADDLGAVEQSLGEVSGEVQRFEQAVGVRLDGIDAQLAKPIELPPPICKFPETPAVAPASTTCEAPAETLAEPGTDKAVVGSVERIRVTPPGIDVTARIDTGADSNSMSATNLVYLERDGDDWVRFDFETRDGTHTLERRVRRFVRVFQQSDADGTRRPVVRMRVQLGQVLGNFDFNLSDRTHLEHAVILGRSLLMDLMVVDVSQEFLQPLTDGED